jgi:hypothetical protein
MIVIELLWQAWRGAATLAGASIGDAFPCVHAIAGCIGHGSDTCHLLIAQRGHL